MLTKLISSAVLVAALVGGSLVGTGAANATPMREVCRGIDNAPTYEYYLVNAAVWGKAFNANSNQQAQNIVDSVRVYCPWHGPGILAAAEHLSGNSNA